MKSKDIKILRDKNVGDLEKQVLDLKSKLVTITPVMYAKGEGNLRQRKFIRRDIAQIMTTIAEKQNSLDQEVVRVKKEDKK